MKTCKDCKLHKICNWKKINNNICKDFQEKEVDKIKLIAGIVAIVIVLLVFMFR